MLQDARRAGSAHAFRTKHILDRKRHASQRPKRLAFSAPPVNLLGVTQCVLVGHGDKRAYTTFYILYAVEMRPRQLDGGDLTPRERLARLADT